MEGKFSEYNGIKAIVPADLNATPIVGSVVDMKDSYRVAILLNYGGSTGAAVGITLRQYDGSTTKDLSISSSYFIKADAETKYTKVDFTGATLDLATELGDVAGHVVIEVLAEDLDRNNGFYGLSVNLASAGAIAKVVSAEYVLCDTRFRPSYELDL